ncbi:Rpn family recombination-promoting nuclease/putative transposase [Yokenella regensburgei]|uniref:Rpn family recombination-promoting nuclease/putative transposase n=1 Tax=Yokenella regensburgei TaxID=158877 RepID=UPI003EDAF030
MRPETDVLNKKEAKRKKTAQPVRTDDRLLLAWVLYSWSESDRQAIEIPNHEQRGIEKGRNEGKLEVARTMLQNGIDRNTVMKMTGLTEDDLAQIRH